jgi:probable FeS assembly SUF system protein SufT
MEGSLQSPQGIILQRDCDAVLIPDGTPIKLEEGCMVYITQSLGGNYTVNINGNLARVSSENADALGFSHQPQNQQAPDKKPLTGDGSVDEELVWAQLRTCYDPEIPINMVDLGLIYACNIEPLEPGNRVNITMTLTAPGCGMGDFLAEDVRQKVYSVPNVTEVDVQITFEPQWDQTMMSEAARLQTGLY